MFVALAYMTALEALETLVKFLDMIPFPFYVNIFQIPVIITIIQSNNPPLPF